MTAQITPIERVLQHRSQIMGFAAVWIILYHSFDTHHWEALIPFKPLLAYGWGGVEIFLFVSGLGIYHSLSKRPKANEFYAKRAFKILPIYALTLTVAFWIYGVTMSDYMINLTTVGLWMRLGGNHTIPIFAWYVQAIVLLYLVSFPYFRIFVKKPVLCTAVMVVFGFVYTAMIFEYNMDLVDQASFFGRIPIYFFGMFCGYIANKKFNPIWPIITAIAAYSAYGYFSMKYGGRIFGEHGLNFVVMFLVAPGLSSLLSYIFSFLVRFRVGNYVNQAFLELGIMSLELYLVHEAILKYITRTDLPWIVFFVLSILAAFIFKYLNRYLLHLTKKVVQYAS